MSRVAERKEAREELAFGQFLLLGQVQSCLRDPLGPQPFKNSLKVEDRQSSDSTLDYQRKRVAVISSKSPGHRW